MNIEHIQIPTLEWMLCVSKRQSKIFFFFCSSMLARVDGCGSFDDAISVFRVVFFLCRQIIFWTIFHFYFRCLWPTNRLRIRWIAINKKSLLGAMMKIRFVLVFIVILSAFLMFVTAFPGLGIYSATVNIDNIFR